MRSLIADAAMTNCGGDANPLFTGVLNLREARISRFEDAWFAGLRPAIADYLPPADDPLRAQVLAELVVIDLECRLTAGEPARAEEYLRQFPEIAGDQERVLQLLAHEFEIRQQREAVTLDEYASRFPEYVALLRARVSQNSARSMRDARSTLNRARCPRCGASFDYEAAHSGGQLPCPNCNEAVEIHAPEVPEQNLAGPVRMGRFELLEVAGRGAFGTVWRARDTQLDRLVAVKIPSGGRLVGAEEEDRFLREARSMAQLRHPGVVTVYESGRFDGVPYIVQEFIDGTPLSQALASRRFPVREAAEVLRRIARALDYAHEQGVVHRDLKPSNVMLDSQPTHGSSSELQHASVPFVLDYEPRVMDFGLALRDHGEATVTVDGQIVGTAAYMSPEQARGDSHHVDRRSDVYSVGVILYEMLAGETPFRGNLRMVLQQVLHDEPRAIRRLNDRVPRDLETICLKCLEKEPRSRYQSAGELADELERFLTDRPITARPAGRAERAWRWCRRHPTVASLSATIVAVVALGFVGVTCQWLATRRAEHGRTLAQVDALLGATPESIATLLKGLEPYRAEVAPVLQRRLSEDTIGAEEKLRARLGLLPHDESQAQALFDELFATDMGTFLVLRQQLLSCPVRFEDRLLGILRDEAQAPDKRFRAVCFLAASPHVPQPALDAHADFTAQQLVNGVLANPSDYAVLRDALQPMASLLTAGLSRVFSDGAAAESSRRAATNLLADYARNEPIALSALLLDAEPWQVPILTPVIAARQRAEAVGELTRFLNSARGDQTARLPLDRLAQQQANAAIALVHLGASSAAWPLLTDGPDLSARSYFIDRFPRAGSSIRSVLDQLESEKVASVRRGLLLTLGGFETTAIAPDDFASAKQELLTTLAEDPHPGTHAAARWLLTQWGLGADVDRSERDWSQLGESSLREKRWYVNTQQHTMLIAGPAKFLMGSPPDEPDRHPEERLQEIEIGRRFAIAMCETTIEQFRRFDRQWKAVGSQPDNDLCPVYFVSWNQAAAYCNWLSHEEEIPQEQWCYVPDPNNDGVFHEADRSLDRSGYRLPTEAEWEYACRAGTTTARFYGHSAQLLPRYAWCPANSPKAEKHPVGLKKPNELGLFDVYGNADELCHDHFRDPATGAITNYVITRGGAAGDSQPPRSAMRNRVFNDPDNPRQGDLAVGFRVARTIDSQPGSSPGQ